MYIITEYDPAYTIRKKPVEIETQSTQPKTDECGIPQHIEVLSVDQKFNFEYYPVNENSNYIKQQAELTVKINEHKFQIGKFIPITTEKMTISYDDKHKFAQLKDIVDFYYKKSKDYIFSLAMAKKTFV